MKSIRRYLAALAYAGVAAVAWAQPTTAPTPAGAERDDLDEFAVEPVRHAWDPIEPVNRAIFRFNDGAYKYVVRPVAHGYTRVVPAPARRGVSNFFDNIRFPVRFTCDVLQGKLSRAGKETGKFLINTTAGVGGLFRPSDSVPALMDVPSEDVGQVFATWHVPAGPYLVLPLLGPSNVRDGVGRIGDNALTPLNWKFMSDYDWRVQASLEVTDTVSALPGAMEFYDSIKKAAIDPYVSAREGYTQYREAQAKK